METFLQKKAQNVLQWHDVCYIVPMVFMSLNTHTISSVGHWFFCYSQCIVWRETYNIIRWLSCLNLLAVTFSDTIKILRGQVRAAITSFIFNGLHMDFYELHKCAINTFVTEGKPRKVNSHWFSSAVNRFYSWCEICMKLVWIFLSTGLQIGSICEQAIDPGFCLNSVVRYAYDTEAGFCVSFNYGGCGGNQNNFATLLECDGVCPPGKKSVRQQWNGSI